MTQAQVEYLDLEDLLAFVTALGLGPTQDAGLLEAACARTRTTAFGIDAYETIEAKAAALLHSLARNHALVDGNKRLAWLATVVFLDLNRTAVTLSDDEVFDLVIDVAAGSADVDEITKRLGASPSSVAGRPGGGGSHDPR